MKLQCPVDRPHRDPADRRALFSAKVVDYGAASIIVRIYGASDKIDVCLSLLKQFEIVELVRSGKILMARGLTRT